MSRPDNGAQVGWLPMQQDALLAWVGAVADIPAGYAVCDGNVYNGYQTKNLNDLALRTASFGDTTYGLINNDSFIGNDLITENTMVFGSNDTHTHEGTTAVAMNREDGEHGHDEGNVSGTGFKVNSYSLHSNLEYGGANASNENIIAPGSAGNNTLSSPGKPLEGDFEDTVGGHNHSVTFDSATDPMFAQNAGNHAIHSHECLGGDGQTSPAQFSVIWLVWVGYN